MPGNIRTPPVEVILSWPKPNYVDPVRRTWMPAYAGTLQAVMTVLLFTRFFLKFRRKAGGLGADDAMLVLSFLGATSYTTAIIVGTEQHGHDRHIWDVPLSTLPSVALVAWICQISYLISTGSTKVSVLLFYRRLSSGTYSRFWKYTTIGAIIFTNMYTVANVLFLIFSCSPTEAYWRAYDPTYAKSYHCVTAPVVNPLSALSVVSDFYAVVLPMGLLWKLNISKRQRYALNALFSLGFIVVGVGIVRVVYLAKLGTEWDLTWLGFNVSIWALLETQLAIVCATVPALRVLFRRYFSLTNNSPNASSGRSSNLQRLNDFSNASTGHTLSFGKVEDEERTISRKTEHHLTNVREVDGDDMAVDVEGPAKTTARYESVALNDMERLKASKLYAAWWNSTEELELERD